MISTMPPHPQIYSHCLHCLGANGLSYGSEEVFMRFFVFYDHGIDFRSVSEKWRQGCHDQTVQDKNLRAVIY